VTITVDRTTPIGVSQLDVGVTHVHNSLDPWGNADAVARGKELLRQSARYQNQHIMGWGGDNPQPAPGVYNWSSLDRRIQLIRDTGGTPVITLCCSPDWMKGGQAGTTDWSKLEMAPLPEHYKDVAELARQVALRYRDVKHFQVWNEMKGFYNAQLNRWNYEGYTAMYNLVYDALKSVDPAIKVGGPYVVMDSWGNAGAMSHNSGLCNTAYGCLDQRPLDVITYWLAHKRGADFIVVDGGSGNWDGTPVNEFNAIQKYADVNNWIRTKTNLPIWWAEWYSTPWGSSNEYEHNHQNVVLALSLKQFLTSNTAVALRWQPQGEATMAYQGNTESIWSDTRLVGGGQPFPFFYTQKAFRDHFGPGTQLYRVSSSSSDVEVLASATKMLLINKRSTSITVNVNGTLITMNGYQVRIL
jgi:hypothetical protein